MTDTGYVYVRGWEKFQHPDARRSEHMPWLKLHTDLLGNDAWLDLCAEDRVLLQTIWMLTARYGNGRLKASLRTAHTESKRGPNDGYRWLMAQANLPYGPRSRNLERLNQAGFISVRASKAARTSASKVASLDKEGSNEPKKKRENAPANGAAPNGAAAALEIDPIILRRRRLEHAIAGARAATEGDPPHLAADTIRKGYDEDLVPDILAALLPTTKEHA